MISIKEYIKTAIVVAISWVLFAVLAAWFLELWPITVLGWIVTLTFGPILFLLWELFEESTKKLIGSVPVLGKLRKKAETINPEKKFSFYRLTYLFILVFIGAVFVVIIIFAFDKIPSNSLGALSDFFKNNFN